MKYSLWYILIFSLWFSACDRSNYNFEKDIHLANKNYNLRGFVKSIEQETNEINEHDEIIYSSGYRNFMHAPDLIKDNTLYEFDKTGREIRITNKKYNRVTEFFFRDDNKLFQTKTYELSYYKGKERKKLIQTENYSYRQEDDKLNVEIHYIYYDLELEGTIYKKYDLKGKLLLVDDIGGSEHYGYHNEFKYSENRMIEQTYDDYVFKYKYSGNKLSEIQEYHSEFSTTEPTKTIDFLNYKYDDHKNWIERVYSDGNKRYKSVRNITYYTNAEISETNGNTP